MTVTASQFLYSDINAGAAYSIPLLYDAQAIQQALDNLLNTRKGQRIFNINYGTNVDQLLLKLFSDDTARLIKKEIYDAVKLFETRVIVSFGKTVVTPDFQTQTYNLKMPGIVKGLTPNSFTYQAALIPPSNKALSA